MCVDYIDGRIGKTDQNGKLGDWKILCNTCGEVLTIHYWADGDVFVDRCSCEDIQKRRYF